MNDAITRAEFFRMMTAAAGNVMAHERMLSELDCVSGDGDHGATMVRTFDRVKAAFEIGNSMGIKAALKKAAWDVMSVDGGASSALFGTLLLGMSMVELREESLTASDCAHLFESGLNAIRKQTPAKPGDKTMVDALAPAVDAFTRAALPGACIQRVFDSAANAARAGAESTANLTARIGRAKFLGEKTRGHCDPGAVSTALFFEGLSQGLLDSRRSTHDA